MYESRHLGRAGVSIWHYAAKANEDHGSVSEELEGWRKCLSHNSITLAELHHPPVRRSCQSLSAKSYSRYLMASDKRTQNHGYVVMPVVANSPAVQHETPSCLRRKNRGCQRGWGHWHPCLCSSATVSFLVLSCFQPTRLPSLPFRIALELESTAFALT